MSAGHRQGQDKAAPGWKGSGASSRSLQWMAGGALLLHVAAGGIEQKQLACGCSVVFDTRAFPGGHLTCAAEPSDALLLAIHRPCRLRLASSKCSRGMSSRALQAHHPCACISPLHGCLAGILGPREDHEALVERFAKPCGLPGCASNPQAVLQVFWYSLPERAHGILKGGSCTCRMQASTCRDGGRGLASA